MRLSEQKRRLSSQKITTRIMVLEDAWAHADGTFTPDAGSITPALTHPDQEDDWIRQRQQVATPGREALTTRVNATVGDITWTSVDAAGTDTAPAETASGTPDQQEVILRSLMLQDLAKRLTREWIVQGIIATLPYRRDTDPPETPPRIGRVTGYIQPLYEDDLDQPVGLFQVKRIPWQDGSPYWVRVYDWSESLPGECVLHQWEGLREPHGIETPPTAAPQIVIRPVVTMLDPTNDGVIISDWVAAIPKMLGVMSTELHLTRNEEFSGHPIPVFDNASDVPVISPSVPVRVQPGGSFQFAQPGNLDPLRERLNDKRQDLGRALHLPSHTVGASTRSGESIREENITFFNQAQSDAHVISQHLTEVTHALAAAGHPVDPHEVTVIPNREYIQQVIIQTTLEALRAGAIPVEAAAREIEPFLYVWTRSDLDAWLETRAAGIGSPEDIAQALNEALA